VVLDDSARGKQAKPSPLARAFGREEVGEQLLPNLGVDAVCVVLHFVDDHAVGLASGKGDLRMRLVAHVARIEGVRHQVGQTRVHARLVHGGSSNPVLRPIPKIETGMACLVGEESNDLRRDSIRIDEVRLGTSATSEAEEFLGELRDARDVVLQHRPALPYSDVAVVLNARAHDIHSSLQTHDDVLDAMGQSCHGLADNCQPLRPQLLLLEQLDLGDIGGYLHCEVDLVLGPDHRNDVNDIVVRLARMVPSLFLSDSQLAVDKRLRRATSLATRLSFLVHGKAAPTAPRPIGLGESWVGLDDAEAAVDDADTERCLVEEMCLDPFFDQFAHRRSPKFISCSAQLGTPSRPFNEARFDVGHRVHDQLD
jgi:hypothetical protein